MEPRRELADQNESLLRDLARIAMQLRLGSNHNGAILRPELLAVARKLAEHHRLEAEQLYPRLVASTRAPERWAARSTERRLTDAGHALERFLERWPAAENIDAHHEAFVEDAEHLVARLRATLVREANEFFHEASR
jgi:hypothetical protein